MIGTTEILNGRLLIVDDQQANVMLLDEMLRGAGYQHVDSTRSPAEVCALHRQNNYDLILLDLQMPVMDGFHVMEELKTIEPSGYLPVLVVTAQPNQKLRALKAGARDFLSKPFDLAEVLARVHNMLEVRLLHASEKSLNNARLENSQRIAGLGDWEYNFVEDRLFWSDELYRILGISRDDFPPSTEAFDRLIHPDDKAIVQRARAAAAKGSFRVDYEHRVIRPDGEVRHFQQIVEMIRDEKGAPVRESGTMQDITERKNSEAALRDSEERYRKLVMLSPDANYVHVDGVLTLVNAAFCQLLGAKEPAQLLGRPAFDIVHPDYRGLSAERRLKHFNEEPTPPVEMKFLRVDGTPIDVEVASVGFNFHGNKEIHVIARDITAKKATEFALRESEERFRFVSRAVSDVVWDWNLVDNALWWNDGFLVTFGFGANEIEPSVTSLANRIHADDRSRVVEGMKRAIANGSETWASEYRIQRKDGGFASVHDRAYILRDSAGKGVRMVGGMRDLTDQKRIESQYMRVQRMESIGTLAGGIAHDLNNVLAPIMMSIELLKDDAADDPGRLKILDTIYASSRRGADLVRQVLSFARGLDGQRVAIRLRPLIDDLKKIVVETFPRSLRIVSAIPDDLWPITGDPTQINQVLLNLAVNARDAMPRNGTLTISASNFTLDARRAATIPEGKVGTYVVIKVSDTGQGIPPEVRERIFEPFFTTKEIGKGTGLGLATVHSVVKGHQGFIRVDSEVGRGTTFEIYFPADRDLKTGGSKNPLVVDIPRGKGELALVVDDEQSIRNITQRTLETFGYKVITATNGAEAVALYAKQAKEIAIVVTDMMMPVMDGAASIQVLMRMNPSVKIIVVSGIDSGDTITKATLAGVKYFLFKPYTAEALLRLFREVLDEEITERIV